VAIDDFQMVQVDRLAEEHRIVHLLETADARRAS